MILFRFHHFNDGKTSKGSCLDCNAEVSAKELGLMMSSLGRDETVRFFLFSKI